MADIKVETLMGQEEEEFLGSLWEQYIASIFRVEEEAKQETSRSRQKAKLTFQP
jgi:hypothetical protein